MFLGLFGARMTPKKISGQNSKALDKNVLVAVEALLFPRRRAVPAEDLKSDGWYG
jgi:hypothetical protein